MVPIAAINSFEQDQTIVKSKESMLANHQKICCHSGCHVETPNHPVKSKYV
jgi:kynurenine formamidase